MLIIIKIIIIKKLGYSLTLKKHCISLVCKHYGNAIFECSLHILKQVVTFKNIYKGAINNV